MPKPKGILRLAHLPHRDISVGFDPIMAINLSSWAAFKNNAANRRDAKRGLLETISNPEGEVSDGYISGANGQVINVATNLVIERFKTNNDGSYQLNTTLDNLPDIIKVIIEPGGTDIATNTTYTSELKAIITKSELNSNNHISINPITSLVVSIAEDNSTVDSTAITNAKTDVKDALAISDAQLNKDYIKENDNIMAIKIAQLETLASTLKDTIGTLTTLTKTQVNTSIAKVLKERSEQSEFSLSSDTNIETIVNKIKTEHNIADSDDFTNIRTNAKDFISTINISINNVSGNFQNKITEATKIKIASSNKITTIKETFKNVTFDSTAVAAAVDTEKTAVTLQTIQAPTRSTVSVPKAPTNLSITGGDYSASASWVAPSDTGGAAITGYKLEYIALPRKVPGAPSFSSSSPASVSVDVATLNWTAPTDNGNAPVLDYTVNYKADAVSVYCYNHGYMGGEYLISGSSDNYSGATVLTNPTVVNVVNTGSHNKYTFNGDTTYHENKSYKITGNGTYIFQNVPSGHPIAILNKGISNITYTGDPTKKSTMTVTGTTNDGTYDFYYGDVTVEVEGGADFRHYASNTAITTKNLTTTCTIPNLYKSVKYFFSVAGNNDIGVGSATETSISYLAATIPGQPTNLTSHMEKTSTTSILLTWSEPNDGGEPIDYYEVQHSSDNGTTWNPSNPYSVSGSTFEKVITGLVSGQSHKFRVRAVNGFDTNNNDLNLSYTGPGEYSVITGIPGRFPVEPLFPTTANAIQTSYILSGYFYKAYSFTGTSGESFTLTSAQKFDIFMIGGGGSGAGTWSGGGGGAGSAVVAKDWSITPGTYNITIGAGGVGGSGSGSGGVVIQFTGASLGSCANWWSHAVSNSGFGQFGSNYYYSNLKGDHWAGNDGIYSHGPYSSTRDGYLMFKLPSGYTNVEIEYTNGELIGMIVVAVQSSYAMNDTYSGNPLSNGEPSSGNPLVGSTNNGHFSEWGDPAENNTIEISGKPSSHSSTTGKFRPISMITDEQTRAHGSRGKTKTVTALYSDIGGAGKWVQILERHAAIRDLKITFSNSSSGVDGNPTTFGTLFSTKGGGGGSTSNGNDGGCGGGASNYSSSQQGGASKFEVDSVTVDLDSTTSSPKYYENDATTYYLSSSENVTIYGNDGGSSVVSSGTNQDFGAGGGGINAVGSNATINSAGAGGAGIANDYRYGPTSATSLKENGSAITHPGIQYYGGGGGGGSNTSTAASGGNGVGGDGVKSDTAAGDAAANTGSGGGGGSLAPHSAGSGSAGIVTVRQLVGAVGVPFSPTNVSGVIGDPGQVQLSWTAPSWNGNDDIIGYTIDETTDNGVNWTQSIGDTGTAAVTKLLTSLTPNTDYKFRVSAKNNNGTGSASTQSSAVTVRAYSTSGGLITNYSSGGTDYEIISFTSSGTFTVAGSVQVDFLIVGGGGGAGARWASGAGGGGVVIATQQSISSGTYQVVVGSGGVGGVVYNSSNYTSGTNGNDSSFYNFIGKGGGSTIKNGGAGNDGGSAGGKRWAGDVGDTIQDQYTNTANVQGYGNVGGVQASLSGAGGGGAGAVGGNASVAPGPCGSGGDGIQNNFRTNVNIYYGGGGGGGRHGAGGGGSTAQGGQGGGGDGGQLGGNWDGSDGEDGKGGGGGGGSITNTNNNWAHIWPDGGSGGDGIVVIRCVV